MSWGSSGFVYAWNWLLGQMIIRSIPSVNLTVGRVSVKTKKSSENQSLLFSLVSIIHVEILLPLSLNPPGVIPDPQGYYEHRISQGRLIIIGNM